MLANALRLKRDSDFKKVLRSGKPVSSEFFNVRAAKNGLGFSRFGFVAGIKVSKKATLRNWARRQAQEAVRLIFDKITPGMDIVFILKSSIVGKKQLQIKEDIQNVIKRARLFT